MITWLQDLPQDLNQVTKQAYREFLDLLFAGFYSFAAQGRNSGIASLTVQDGMDLVRTGEAYSTQFKTFRTYGLQPVTLHPVLRPLLVSYLDILRPAISGNSFTDPKEPLWLTPDGKTMNNGSQVGIAVRRFFLKHLGFPLTINNIRSMVETSTNRLCQSGDISETHQAAIHNINGHNSSTAHHTYIRDSRARDVNLGREVFSRISGNPPPDLSCYQSPAPPTYAPWGAQHPDLGRDGKAKWTEEEIQFLEDWSINDRNVASTFHSNTNNKYSRCLKAVKADLAAVKIFHPRHVADSTRIRGGFEALKRKQRINLKE